jgi:hypothetical protein
MSKVKKAKKASLSKSSIELEETPITQKTDVIEQRSMEYYEMRLGDLQDKVSKL